MMVSAPIWCLRLEFTEFVTALIIRLFTFSDSDVFIYQGQIQVTM